MSYESTKVYEIVDRAVSHNWSIPEFQRGFVWTSTQVRDLAESLWLNYPIGSFLVWDSQQNTPQTKSGVDARVPERWVVDGQQRATALCILFKRKPYWWPDNESWEQTAGKYDIRFDIEARRPPYFWVANAVIRRGKEERYIPLSKVLNLDPYKRKNDEQLVLQMAKDIKSQNLCSDLDDTEIFSQLTRLSRIRNTEVVTITIDHDLEDVVEIFSRLNSKGTRVTEADIYLGIVAARNPGWVHLNFLPYLNKLKDYGFDLDPNLLFRTLTGIGAKKVRFGEIPSEFWNTLMIKTGHEKPVWERTKQAWENLVRRLRDYGLLSNDSLPTEAALVTLTALIDRFPEDPFEPAFYWLIQASRFSRYSGSSTASLEEDLRDVADAENLRMAVQKILRRFPHDNDLTSDDFLRDYVDTRFGRFFLYLMVHRNQALDWDKSGNRLGFEGSDLLEGYRPQWHHVFPKKYLKDSVPDDKVNALANIAVIGPKINIRISNKAPMDYLNRYEISDDKLSQQYIDPNTRTLDSDQFESWLLQRAETLAKAGNEFLSELRGTL